jgi:hypothetical protein
MELFGEEAHRQSDRALFEPHKSGPVFTWWAVGDRTNNEDKKETARVELVDVRSHPPIIHNPIQVELTDNQTIERLLIRWNINRDDWPYLRSARSHAPIPTGTVQSLTPYLIVI